MLVRLLLCLSLLCSAVVAVAADRLPTIAVLDFDIVSKAVRFGPEFSSIVWDEQRTQLLSSDLITSLVNTRKFDVVERDRMQDVMREKDFVSLTQDQAMALGSLLGADYFVMGQIEMIEGRVSQRKIPYTETYRTETTGAMVVNVRIVDTRGGKIVSADKVNATRNISGKESPMAFFENLKEETVKRLVNNIVDGVFPVKIMAVNNNEVFLNRGQGASFDRDTVLVVYEEGEALIDPDTGVNLGSVEQEIGRLRVVEVLDKFSKAEIIENSTELPKGAICRKLPPAPPAAKPAASSAGSSSKPINW